MSVRCINLYTWRYVYVQQDVYKVVEEYSKALKPWSNYLMKIELLDDHHGKIQTRAMNQALTLVF